MCLALFSVLGVKRGTKEIKFLALLEPMVSLGRPAINKYDM